MEKINDDLINLILNYLPYKYLQAIAIFYGKIWIQKPRLWYEVKNNEDLIILD